MDRLPRAILNQVFIQLHQHDKVQCMLVCHNWAEIIKAYTLYHTIKLTKGESFQQLLEILQEEPSRGNQVEWLIFGHMRGYEQEIDPNLIIDFLPNLRLIESPAYKNKQIINTQIQQQRQINIEHIIECIGCYFASQVLSTSFCARLKSLSVASNSIPQESARIIINLLVNAPALTDLCMTGFMTTFEDLESLHTNLPLISSIILRYTQLLNGDSFSTVDIQPAISVSKLVLELSSASITDFSNWTRYINKKYTKLTEFGVKYLGLWHVSSEIVDRISKEELASLIQGFGPQLKILSLNIPGRYLNYFKFFEKANFKMQSFSVNMNNQQEIIPDLILLDRLRYIHTLKLSFHKLANLEWLRELGSLKELELNCTFLTLNINGVSVVKNPFQLNQILDMCVKTLESLKISCYPINVDSSDTRQYAIKRLNLNHVPLPRNFDSFISTSLPKLESLFFRVCNLKGYRFSLPHHHLLSVEIKEIRTFNMLLLETENSRRWYAAMVETCSSPETENLVGKSDRSIYPSSYSRPYNTWNGAPSMVFSCASVRSLIITKFKYD